ncbi:cAMP and cAMP-inhibited cGMP 3',5'-cyclic phosphodiesterase 10A-like [Lingula anatina]|uniref:Phosphodiesterase n=1 Tax=Lingula anatina TaxID=7574 RepID=A0A2R2MJ03_LINAN|nr:cAMP and cAMP-inhibited cGMP 3',5'-cyclic phosphodiesterase 10A-like [Lingula anatina]|eukprot:XP_023930195.1 cAMP and cAMP-inhibited cGMP 3',5'-cyclic phosphodiesterase 10A-like [Lingula anatina]
MVFWPFVFSLLLLIFSTSKGIAGHVARTGEVVNIADVYADPRFNREIDRQTGYTTHNMLAMPIISKGAVIGVVQMVNKRNGPRFSSADESAFKTFAVYCALALHISKAYRDMRHQQNLFNVAREMVGYYTQCSAEEVEALLADPFPRNFPEDFFKITYDCKGHENQMVKQMVYMFYDLFGTARFDLETLCRFVLSVKKSYRHAVPYHNFAHGFFVCHCLYLVLRELRWELFTENEALTLMVAALCHDVDHRGKNNSFLQKLNEPLWHIYSGSVMEKHHFQCTVGILQKQGHDLFGSMGSEEYKEALGMVRTAILDTDLLQFLPAQKKVAKWLEDGVFDVNNPEHRGEFISILMTACDLNSMCKQQECHIREVSLLYEEFYKQGDEEKLHGVEPLPMMDRSQKDKIPSQQVGFIKHICIPCYTTIVHILPFMQPMLDGLQRNLEYWQSLQNKEAMWEPEKSRPTPES